MTPPENDLRDAVAPEVTEALATFQKQYGYHRPCIEDLLVEFGGIVAGLITDSLAKARADLERVTAERDADRAEATRLRALLVELTTKADDQLAYWRQRMAAEKCLDDGVSEDGQTYTPIGDVAAWSGGYCNGRLSEADWWRLTLKYGLAALDKAPTPKEHGDASV